MTHSAESDKSRFFTEINRYEFSHFLGDSPYSVFNFTDSGKHGIVVEAVACSNTGRAAEGRYPIEIAGDKVTGFKKYNTRGRKAIVVDRLYDGGRMLRAVNAAKSCDVAGILYISESPLRFITAEEAAEYEAPTTGC